MGRRTDLLTDAVPSRSTAWPVQVWKSPTLHAPAPTALKVSSPIPPHAFVDFALENLSPDGGYSIGHLARNQRTSIVGANDFIHPAWYADEKSMYLLSGNAGNAYYLGNRLTGVSSVLTAAKWNQRLYGAWPIPNPGAIHPRSQGMDRLFLHGDQLSILKKAWRSPWVRGDALAGVSWQSWDIRNVSRGDEPAFLQLWARPILPEGGYCSGHEVCVRGSDFGGGGGTGEVWYSKSEVGFSAGANFGSGLSISGSAMSFARSKWEFQLRAAFASAVDYSFLSRQYRDAGNHFVQFWASPWADWTDKTTYFQIPENFIPLDVTVALRCKVGVMATSGWRAGDQQYSTHAGYSGYVGFGSTIIRMGSTLIIPSNAAVVSLSRSGTGAGRTVSTAPLAQMEFQIRAIG